MTGNIILFRRNALREAFAAGEKSALADPANLKDIFDAGEKKGAAWLNESINAPSFMEIMTTRRSDSPGDFKSWLNTNEKKLMIPVVHSMFSEDDEDTKVIFVKGNKKITLEAIGEAVAASFKIGVDELRNNRRRYRKIKTPRYFCFYLAYFHVGDELRKIGQQWGGMNYATVIHGAKQISYDASTYPEDKELLIDAYVYLIKNGYNTDEVICGKHSKKRESVEFINLDI
jgi:hypothetical protein